jgi:exosortase/archaeosortase family protein
MQISKKAKIGYFAVGAAITYSINILRIATVFTIGMTGENVQMFHFYYGPLYSITWIVSYPLLILGSQIIWRKFVGKNAPVAKKPQPPQPNPA